MKAPLASVIMERICLVRSCVSWALTPEMGASEASVTVPVIWPVTLWAYAVGRRQNSAARVKSGRRAPRFTLYDSLRFTRNVLPNTTRWRVRVQWGGGISPPSRRGAEIAQKEHGGGGLITSCGPDSLYLRRDTDEIPGVADGGFGGGFGFGGGGGRCIRPNGST